MDFNNRVVATIDVLGFDLWITQTHVSTWIIMGVLLLLALVVRIALKRFQDVPTAKGQNIVELMVESMDNFVTSTMGKENRAFGAWFFGVFTFILVSNYSGLLALRPPTADLSTTLALTVATFILIHFCGATKNTKGYLKGFFEPTPIMFPMNVVGELSVLLSLSIRLFGNILSGFIILGLLYYLLPIWLTLALPSALHFYFDIFAGGIQAFIFTMLSMIFIKDKL